MLVLVSLSYNIVDPLTYRYNGDPDLLRRGQRVVVPLLNRFVTGWVVDRDVKYKGRVKSIVGIISDNYIASASFLKFAQAVSCIYFTSAGIILDSSLNPKFKTTANLYLEHEGKPVKFKTFSFKDLSQLSKQSGCLKFFYKSVTQPIETSMLPDPTHTGRENPAYTRFLLSYSRLEDYRQIIQETLEKDQSVLIAVPDNVTAAYFKHALGKMNPDIYNSDQKMKERDLLWRAYVQEGKTGILVGGLSAALMPIGNLGLILVDRAGSPLYRRSAFSRYNVRNLAQLRATYENVSLLEGFSTLTVHAYQHIEKMVDDRRVEAPTVEVHPILQRTRGVPDNMVELVKADYSEGKKTLIIVNRKKSRQFLFCPACKKMSNCPRCNRYIEVGENFHIHCGYCSFEQEEFSQCPKCRGGLSIEEDLSISSVKKIIKKEVVETGIVTLSADDLKADLLEPLLKKIGEGNVVIATTAVVNPYFKDLFDTIVYLRPESYVNLDEYDAAQAIFALCSELKETVKPGGTVDIFSTFHFHYSLQLVNEEEAFFKREKKYRQWFLLPPFANVYQIEIKSKALRSLAKEMREIYQTFKETLGIKKIFLNSRSPVRGNFKGTIEAHALPEAIRQSGLLSSRDITIQLDLV